LFYCFHKNNAGLLFFKGTTVLDGGQVPKEMVVQNHFYHSRRQRRCGGD